MNNERKKARNKERNSSSIPVAFASDALARRGGRWSYHYHGMIFLLLYRGLPCSWLRHGLADFGIRHGLAGYELRHGLALGYVID